MQSVFRTVVGDTEESRKFAAKVVAELADSEPKEKPFLVIDPRNPHREKTRLQHATAGKAFEQVEALYVDLDIRTARIIDTVQGIQYTVHAEDT